MIGKRYVWLLLLLVVCCQWLHAVGYSGTLPVLFIHTYDSITSKTDYVSGLYYLDPMGCEDVQAIGSEQSPLTLEIRGRGNWTWAGNFEKKPYKIKLGTKQSLLGLKKHKHFALLAHADGGIMAFFRNTAGFELSRFLELDYTPEQRPVELVINDSYEGLYFLTETIRVDKNRLRLTEQDDLSTDKDSITGGWLVEIDNNVADNQLKIPVRGTDLYRLLLTYHYPENLSDEQEDYLMSQMTQMLAAVYQKDKNNNSWEELIDLETLVRYYLVQEILINSEAFLGSCFLHKNRGETAWKFGPVWDFGQAFNGWHDPYSFCYDYNNGWASNIMRELAKYPHLQQRIVELWGEVYPAIFNHLESYLRAFADEISAACVCDHERWPESDTGSAAESLDYCLTLLEHKRRFLVSSWGPGNGIVTIESDRNVRPNRPLYDLQGRQTGRSSRKGIVIHDGRKRIYK